MEKVDEVDDRKFITRIQQKLLISMRQHDGKIEGCEGIQLFHSSVFYPAMEELVKSGWVEKRWMFNKETGKQKSVFKLTKSGLIFNAAMMEFWAYRPLWNRMSKKITFGVR